MKYLVGANNTRVCVTENSPKIKPSFLSSSTTSTLRAKPTTRRTAARI
jgi:hypothetical protein